MFICIAGNVDTEKVLNQIKGAIKESNPVEIERFMNEEPEEVAQSYIEQKLAVAQPMFCLGYKEKCENPEKSIKEKVCAALLIELLAGESSPLYAKLVKAGLINDEFSGEYFSGYGYAALTFDGESDDPKKVAEEIHAEIERIKAEGIVKKLFSAIRRGMYGNAIRLFNSVESIAMQMVDSAMSDCCLFDEIKYLKSVTIDDVYRKLLQFSPEKSVLSVINPLEEV